MPNRTVKIEHLRRKVAASAERTTPHLVGGELDESGLLDRAVLNRQISVILEGVSEEASLAPRLERSLASFLRAIHQEDIKRASRHVCALLSFELDDLRKGALLSLMVRLAGKRKFDPIAAYILQNRKVLVTGRG